MFFFSLQTSIKTLDLCFKNIFYILWKHLLWKIALLFIFIVTYLFLRRSEFIFLQTTFKKAVVAHNTCSVVSYFNLLRSA